jgi:hypothetical protein
MPDDPAERDLSLESLDKRQDQLDRKLDEVLGLLRPKGTGSQPTASSSPGATPSSEPAEGPSIEEQVSAELARRDKKAAEEKATADAASERDQMKADLAALKERKPQAPVRRATRLLGWGDGRS